MKSFILFLSVILFFSCSEEEKQGSVDLKDFKNYNRSAKELLKDEKLAAKDIRIYIDKSAYKLSLKYGDKILKEYPVVFGENPVEDKRREGDMCTPEGHFKIRDLYPHKKWTKFIWIDYPTADSERKFKESKQKGEIPQNATIGGEVGIHGVREGKDHLIMDRSNWTWGCISMKNKDVDDLYSICSKGMEIEIVH